MRLEGQTAVVTGAGRGIGLAIATRFAHEGADVVCISRSERGAEAAAMAVRAEGRRAVPVAVDVADTNAVEDAIRALDRVDILVNNAGVTRDGLLVRMKEEDWDAVLDTNLKGAFNCARAAAKTMMKQRSGRILNITSVVGISGNAGQANYAASKAGLIGLTKSLARELGSRGITCNAIAPGFIETDMTAQLSDDMRERVTKNCSLGRLGSVEDVAAAALFFCSTDAAFITGQVLCVDGGLSL